MNFIVAVDENYAIGIGNKLLTYLPEDLNYFKEMTVGKVVVMGRKTLQSLKGAKPLPNRTTIVLSRDKTLDGKGATVVTSIEELMAELKSYNPDDIFISGGENIYRQLIPFCKYGYITKIRASFEGDTWIDNIDKKPNWELVSESEEKSYKGTVFTWTKYRNSAL
jgi:dihydrofolate reductase